MYIVEDGKRERELKQGCETVLSVVSREYAIKIYTSFPRACSAPILKAKSYIEQIIYSFAVSEKVELNERVIHFAETSKTDNAIENRKKKFKIRNGMNIKLKLKYWK